MNGPRTDPLETSPSLHDLLLIDDPLGPDPWLLLPLQTPQTKGRPQMIFVGIFVALLVVVFALYTARRRK